MSRPWIASLAAWVLTAAVALAQDGPQRATIKKVDAAKGTITLTVDGKDREFRVDGRTRLPDAGERTGNNRLKADVYKPGTRIMFLVRNGDDSPPVLQGLKLAGATARPQEPPPKVDTSRLKPLPELGTGQYQGFPGGLYPDGKNERPAAHEKAGLALARQVRPLDADGKPADDGKIVLLAIGMSNTTQEFSVFQRLANADPDKNPRLVLVDGAQGGMTAQRIQDPASDGGKRYWETVDQRLRQAGASRAQVQAVWIKQADAGPSQGFPRYAKSLQQELARIVRLLHDRFPNLKLAYLSSRTYGGYARTRLNPEPYAYESSFAVKWLIEQQLKGDPELNFDPAKGAVKAPWLSWGPYLWAKGTTPNADGLSYSEEDFGQDGTHPSQSGRRKVAERLLSFFKTDATAKPWFVAR